MFSIFFINRPVFAMVISIVIVIVGVITIPILPVESTPDITPPTVSISTRYPGADAQVVADAVTAPIEQQINGVEDMNYMLSKSSSDGSMNLTVTFELGTDPDMATVLTQNRVAIAEPLLPEEVKRQGITVQKQSTNMVLMVSVISPGGRFDELYISNYVTTRIKDVLARVNGVGKVEVFGAKDFGMRIWLDPARLKARDLTSDEVIAALREQNVQVAAGKIGAPPNPAGLNYEYTVTTLGRLSEVEQFEQIIVKTGRAGELVRVRDVARVELGAQSYHWYAELNGAPAIAMGIYQTPGSNALSVADGVQSTMEELKRDFPADLDYRIAYDSTRYISASIDEVVETLIIAIILVIFTVFVFLQDFRTTLIPSITIPVSLIGTFAVLNMLGMSINNLTLFGLVLAIGIVVDDSIMVVENTMRLIDGEKLPAKEATKKTMIQVSGPVIATTLVLLAVFVPTTMMPGITGRLYKQFAITISVATVFSSVNALTLSPALCGILLRPSPEKRNRIFTAFNNGFERMTGRYMGLVGGIMRKSAMAMLIWVVLLGATYLGVTSLPGGFVPEEDQGYFIINAQLPNAASLDRMKEVMDHVIRIVLDTPGVESITAIGGYSLLDGVASTNAGMAFVGLKPWAERQADHLHVDAIIARVQAQFAQIQEGIVFGFPPAPIQGLGTAGGFEMQLQDRGGAGLQQLEVVARDIVAAGTQSPVVTRLNQNLRTTVPQLFVDVDRERTKAYGVSLQTVFNTLGANLGSAYVNDFNLFGRTWKVMAQADEQYRAKIGDIGRLEVRNNHGQMIPIATLAAVRDTVGPQSVRRFNMFPSSTITGGPNPGFSDGQATAEMELLAHQLLPPSMGYEWSGVTYEQKKAGNLAPIIFGLAIVFVFLFLAAQYESWHIPLAVMFSVPLAILGAALLTMARGMENNIYMQIGLVLLIGLSSKSAIMIVEFAKQLREEGKSVFDAAFEAAHLRFRPILMTAFSFILGVIPLVIASGAGAESRKSLGSAVFGGMLAGTILGVFMIPLLYLVVQKTAEKLGGKKEKAAKPAVDPQSA